MNSGDRVSGLLLVVVVPRVAMMCTTVELEGIAEVTLLRLWVVGVGRL